MITRKVSGESWHSWATPTETVYFRLSLPFTYAFTGWWLFLVIKKVEPTFAGFGEFKTVYGLVLLVLVTPIESFFEVAEDEDSAVINFI